ncbi:MAG TPA: prolyl oligopeptidase family serine peptidase [Thermoanaerobaculia bacterium]|jgi:predicted peptidase
MRRLLLLFTAVFLGCQTAPMRETGFLARSLTIGATSYPYVVYVPRDYDAARAWPVILFLHGSGERGTDGWRETIHGVANTIRFDPARVPAIVVFPQAPPETRWLDEPADAAMLALDHAIAEFHGDESRVYITGLSMGGYGTLHLAMAHPNRFAAAVVVCGGLLPHPTTTAVQQSPLTTGGDPYAIAASRLRELPMWFFHGKDDNVIPIDESRHLVDELHHAGACDVHFTEYEGVGHGAWDRAYGEAAMWNWLFEQKRVESSTTSR